MASLAQLNTEALLNGCSCKSKDFAFQSAHPQLCLVFGGFFSEGGKGNLRFKAKYNLPPTRSKEVFRKITALLFLLTPGMQRMRT